MGRSKAENVSSRLTAKQEPQDQNRSENWLHLEASQSRGRACALRNARVAFPPVSGGTLEPPVYSPTPVKTLLTIQSLSNRVHASLRDADPPNNDPGSSCQATVSRLSGTKRGYTLLETHKRLSSRYVDAQAWRGT
jgi:hypothetical protein